MNSLNIVSRLTSTPPPSPPRSRTNSISLENSSSTQQENVHRDENGHLSSNTDDVNQNNDFTNDKTPLLPSDDDSKTYSGAPRSFLWRLPSRITEAIVYSVKLVLMPLIVPGRYVVACFYDEHGHFSAMLPLRKLRNLTSRRRRKQAVKETSSAWKEKEELQKKSSQSRAGSHKRSPSVESTASTTSIGSSDNESSPDDSPSQHTRSKSATGNVVKGNATGKRSSQVKLLDNDQALRSRHKGKSRQLDGTSGDDNVAALATSLKSPSSASVASRLTRYPRAPAPPRPLVPRRQPSYSLSFAPEAPRKTLIIDLDETLIHSMARGGRMSTGHMVEVRLGGAVSGSGLQIGPGVPILYYVHERPGCHDFLRKVCKWFNLIVFTASVQEYADPVIDWLERERKYFAGRYYRQHCTFRNGAYIKDLAQVEPDLSKVMILDNSPMSYIFHEDNAIPIEGWISDPTDNDLLHLVPFLEGLQYVTDVRALLALRHGQAQQA